MNKSNVSHSQHAAQMAQNALRGFRLTWAALAIGSRWVPLADNRQLLRELAARTAGLHEARR